MGACAAAARTFNAAAAGARRASGAAAAGGFWCSLANGASSFADRIVGPHPSRMSLPLRSSRGRLVGGGAFAGRRLCPARTCGCAPRHASMHSGLERAGWATAAVGELAAARGRTSGRFPPTPGAAGWVRSGVLEGGLGGVGRARAVDAARAGRGATCAAGKTCRCSRCRALSGLLGCALMPRAPPLARAPPEPLASAPGARTTRRVRVSSASAARAVSRLAACLRSVLCTPFSTL